MASRDKRDTLPFSSARRSKDEIDEPVNDKFEVVTRPGINPMDVFHMETQPGIELDKLVQEENRISKAARQKTADDAREQVDPISDVDIDLSDLE